MTLIINISQQEHGILVISPAGSIDSETYESLKQELDTAIDSQPGTVVLNMNDVEFISSAGIGAINQAKNNLKQNGMELLMVNLQPQIEAVFETMHLLPCHELFKSEKELDEYLSSLQKAAH